MFHSLNSTQDQFRQVISKLGNMPLAEGYDVEEVGDVVVPARLGFCGGVLLLDGNVLLIPLQRGEFWLYDPITRSTSFACLSPEGDKGYWGGVLLPDGNVLLIPAAAKRCALFSASGRSCRAVGDVLNPSGSGDYLLGGALLPNGLVLMAPFSATGVFLYDYKTETTIRMEGNFAGFIGCQLLPDGRCLLVPRNNSRCLIYDCWSGAFEYTSSANGHCGGALLPDGNVLMPYYVSNQCRVYDPSTEQARLAGESVPGSILSGGSAHLGDGSVIVAPRHASRAYVYNSNSESLAPVPGVTGGGDAYVGAISLPDGGVLLIPRSKPKCMLVKPRGVTPLPLQTCLSPYLNKF